MVFPGPQIDRLGFESNWRAIVSGSYSIRRDSNHFRDRQTALSDCNYGRVSSRNDYFMTIIFFFVCKKKLFHFVLILFAEKLCNQNVQKKKINGL